MPDITSPRPVDGEPVATLWGQQVHDAIETILGAAWGFGVPAASFSPPFSTYTLIPGVTLTTTPGKHVVIFSASVDSTSAGFGICRIGLYVDGVAQSGVLEFAGAAGTRASIAGAWLINVTGAGVLEWRASKSINGGQAQVVATTCLMVVI